METLGQYFSYNSDPEKIREIFINLDEQLKIIHSRGFAVEINSSSIVYENGFGFSRFVNGLNEDMRRKNIEDLAKLAVGAYFSLPTGTFSDYTHLPTDYVKNNFDVMEGSIYKMSKNDNYYRDVFNGNVGYYCDYLKTLKDNSVGKDNSRVLAYSTAAGRAMTDKENAAFIDLVFYPVIGTLTAILGYMIYILFK